MNTSQVRIAILVLLVALCAPLAKADPVLPNDPRIIINDPPACITITSVFSTTFTFTSNSSGSGFLCFRNESQVAWFNISIDVPQPPNTTFPSDFSCGSDIFNTCTFSLSGGILNIFFTDGLLPDDGRFFTIDLSSDGTGWGPNTEFRAAANVPEPGTVSLLAIGFGALAVRRRMRRVASA